MHDDDHAPLGNYLFVSKSSTGSIYVSDLGNSRVVVFNAAGQIERLIGKKGNGPGEFQAPGVNAMLSGDSLLAVVDAGSRRVSIFRTADATFLRAVTLPTGDVGINWSRKADTATFALNGSTALFARWGWRGDTIQMYGSTPKRLLSDPFTVLQHGRSEAIPTSNGVVALLPTDPGLNILDAAGHATGFVLLPARRRRGEPNDLFKRAAELQAKGGPMGLAPIGSMVVGMHALGSGQLATVTLDVDQLAAASEGHPGAQLFGNFRLYVSLLSKDLSKSCVDALVPIQTDVAPNPFFTGDTLWVLTRRVTPGDSVQTIVQGFLIGDHGCQWIATGGIGPARP
ncbi:MAG: 6-bladed beta-propeller [Gemmatimonadota bacterium]